MRVVPALGLAKEPDLGGTMVGWRGIVRIMVLRRVAMCEAVTHLGEEKSQPQETGDQNSGDARATQVSHRGKITRNGRVGSVPIMVEEFHRRLKEGDRAGLMLRFSGSCGFAPRV